MVSNGQSIGAGITERFGIASAMRKDVPDKETVDETGRTPSFYMIMSRDSTVIEKFKELGSGWHPIESQGKIHWTDEHTNVLDVIVW